jgi:hypothetical protein
VNELRKDLSKMQMMFDAEVDQLNAQIAEKNESTSHYIPQPGLTASPAIDMLTSENQTMRAKVSEIDFLKRSIDELREQVRACWDWGHWVMFTTEL